ncbi:MAG: DNA adenine methylase [Glutamicibacter ardleyensis]
MRPIHYLGNKSRYLVPIIKEINSIADKNKSVIDLFAGTGVVTRAMAQYRPVHSVDIQKYSAVLSRALCSPTSYTSDQIIEILFKAQEYFKERANEVRRLLKIERSVNFTNIESVKLLVEIIENGSLMTGKYKEDELSTAKYEALVAIGEEKLTIFKYYGGVYFSYEQALQIDSLLWAIGHLEESPAEPTLLASVLGVASDLVTSVGNHFAQPISLRSKNGDIKPSISNQKLRSRKISAFVQFESWVNKYKSLTSATNECTPWTSDYRTILFDSSIDAGAIYADPPYTRDHYSRFYHVLETIATGDDPGIADIPGTNMPSRGLYRINRHQSPFSIRSKATAAFDEIFRAGAERGIPVLLSYSPQGSGTAARKETRLMSIEKIFEIAHLYYNDVEYSVMKDSTHSKFNRSELNGSAAPHAEILITAKF